VVVKAYAAQDAMPSASDERDVSWVVQVANKAADAYVNTMCGPPKADLSPDWFDGLGVGAQVAEWAAQRELT
jgi:hypothetical protein